MVLFENMRESGSWNLGSGFEVWRSSCHADAVLSFHSDSQQGRCIFSSALRIEGGMLKTMQWKLKLQKTINFVLLAPSMLIQSSQDMSAGTSESESTSSRIRVERTLRVVRPSRNNILCRPHVAMAMRRSRACAVSVESLGPGTRSADVDVPFVQSKPR